MTHYEHTYNALYVVWLWLWLTLTLLITMIIQLYMGIISVFIMHFRWMRYQKTILVIILVAVK